jgi:gluconolactonase
MQELSNGLRFPEGPVVMPDGAVALVEIEAGRITQIAADGTKTTLARLKGGPNGMALGPDGKLFICNNGGFIWHEEPGMLRPIGQATDYTGGRIEVLDIPTGTLTVLYDRCGDHRLKGPNDIVFDPNGGFWFSDHAKTYSRHRDHGGLYYARPDGSKLIEAAYHMVSPNGVGLSPDEKIVYMADTHTGRLWAFDIEGEGVVGPAGAGQPGRCVVTMPGYQLFDSLAVEADGRVCVATLINGGITAIEPSGAFAHHPFPDLLVTNIAFGGPDMRDAYITLSGTGKLIKVRWPRPGLKLNFNPYP